MKPIYVSLFSDEVLISLSECGQVSSDTMLYEASSLDEESALITWD